jgi:cupin superfamily protein
VDFAQFIAPLPVDRFMAEYFGRGPVHIRASGNAPRREIMTWPRLNTLLALRAHWTEANLSLVRNGRAILPDSYLEEIPGATGPIRLASPAKVEAFLAMGASLVANSIHYVSPEVRQVTDLLADRFAAQAGANLYCSFEGVQAFTSHYDAHDVFALHCEGEKVWRIYRNPVENPLQRDLLDTAAVERDNAAKGEVMLEARLRPGDLLYIPRGFFHDALAASGESLHLSLSVKAASGAELFPLLKEAALREPAFRAYLPDAREADGAALRLHLDGLAGRVAEILRSPAFHAEVADSQRAAMRPAYATSLPSRPTPEFLGRTRRPAMIEHRDGGAVLVAPDSAEGEAPLGALAEAAGWVLTRTIFSLQELIARHPHQDREEIRALAGTMARLGLVQPCKPSGPPS